MRDILEELFADAPIDPVEAARRNAKPNLRARFYKDVDVQRSPAGFAVRLDGRPIRTPGRRPLSAPIRAVAEGIAREWQAQGERIDPATMPLTRLANTIIDGVSEAVGEVRQDIQRYLNTDMVCYRAEGPASLVARQDQHWNPVLAWARDALGARFILVQGVTFAGQPEGAIPAAASAIPEDAWPLGAMHVVTTLTGSALIALALAAGRITVEEAWAAAHVDEDWQMDQWGRDEVALGRRGARFAEMTAAARILTLWREARQGDWP